VTSRRSVVAACVAVVVAATGCADPYADEPPSRVATVPGELPAPPVSQPAERLGVLPTSPEAAARRAAELTTTWTSANVARRHTEFATFATGAARRRAQEAAARLPTDPQLEGASGEGRVIGVLTRAATRSERELLVVTHEKVRADGLVDERWRVTLASVKRRRRGWAVVRWDPQP
jgi:hypothetical protein